MYVSFSLQLEEANNELRMLHQFKGHPNIVDIVDTSNVGVGKKTSTVRQVRLHSVCWGLGYSCAMVDPPPPHSLSHTHSHT